MEHIGFCLVVGAVYLFALAVINLLEATDKFKRDKPLLLDYASRPLKQPIRINKVL